jgi:methylmalonyl-CoA mutase N-terminal domain/subunit
MKAMRCTAMYTMRNYESNKGILEALETESVTLQVKEYWMRRTDRTHRRMRFIKKDY